VKRWLVPLLVVAPVLAGIWLAEDKPTYGCSYFGDLVEDSDVIVAGRFSGWELDTGALGTHVYDPPLTGGLVVDSAGVRAEFAVDRILKGRADEEITIKSGNTVDVYDHEPKYVWVGPKGACGAFADDPTGKYAILGLSRDDEGSLRVAIFSWFYSGDDLPTDYSDRSLSRLSPLRPGYSPGGDILWPVVVLAALSPLPFLAALAFMWRRENHQRMGSE
jgi:hypothetical protein